MSGLMLDERVGQLEEGFRRIQLDVHETKSDVRRLHDDVAELKSGIKQLLERDLKRPEPLSWGKIGVAAATTIATLVGLWGLITQVVAYASAEKNEAIDKRITRLENRLQYNNEFVDLWNKDGRLILLEQSVRRLEQTASWIPTVKR